MRDRHLLFAGALLRALATGMLGVLLGVFLARLGLGPARIGLVALVGPHERTTAAGVTSLVQLWGWAIAPSFAGLLMQGSSLAAPLMVGAGMKIAYDLLLYAGFRRLRPPEEAR